VGEAVFTLQMFPALDGDCLLLSYGDGGPMRHLLIDGGRTGTYRSLKAGFAALAERGEAIELLVLTHIDADHIEGFLPLAADRDLPVEIGEVWFNGFDQLSTLRPMGPGQGDRFSAAIAARGWQANARFRGRAIAVGEGSAADPIVLPGGLKLTLLSPDAERLATLRDEWEEWRLANAAKAKQAPARAPAPDGLEAFGRKPMPRHLDVDALADGREVIDHETPNGSSIAFVAEWDGKRVLFAGDAHPDRLVRSLARLAAPENGRYRLDLFKVSHHGSIGNTTRDLAAMVDCRRFAISTNGSRHGHPDPEAIAKLIKYAPAGAKTFYFNYRQERTAPWDAAALRAAHGYECVFPARDGSLVIAI
jgi:hypothetical protein